MTFEEAKRRCHVRSSIFRLSNPDVKYPKNHSLSFDERVPKRDQLAPDWEEYDPREYDDCSLAWD